MPVRWLILPGFTGLGLRDLTLELVGERLEFPLGHAERLGVVAKDAFGRRFDAPAHFLDAAAGPFLGAVGLG